MKTITQAYSDARDLPDRHLFDSVPGFLFDLLMNKYGIKRIAEQKFTQTVAALVLHRNRSPRTTLFGRFMQLHRPLAKPAFLAYIEIVENIANLNVGFALENLEADESHFAPFIRALECGRGVLERRGHADKVGVLRDRAEKLKRPDKKQLNKAGVVDVDEFASLVLAILASV